MSMATKERRTMALKVDARVWHSRLGHASDSKLSHVDFPENFYFIFKDRLCDACVKAKHTQLAPLFPKVLINHWMF